MMNYSYLLLVLVTMALGFAAQAYIKYAYKKFSSVSNGTRLTGAQIARRMLDDNDLHNIRLERVSGTLTDHYDPRSGVIRLSEGVYSSSSVSAMAVACHECGHAVQHARNYVPMNIRTKLVPAVNFGSNAWIALLLIGVVLQSMRLVWLAIILYALAVLFHIVTLPVEFNASRRGLAYIRAENTDMVYTTMLLATPGSEIAKGAQTVLTAAALTYVVSALTSIMELLYFIFAFTRD